jgi:hypothetical protein
MWPCSRCAGHNALHPEGHQEPAGRQHPCSAVLGRPRGCNSRDLQTLQVASCSLAQITPYLEPLSLTLLQHAHAAQP